MSDKKNQTCAASAPGGPLPTRGDDAGCDVKGSRFQFTTRERALRVLLELDRLSCDWARSAAADVGGVPPPEGKRQLRKCAVALTRVLTAHGFYAESEALTSQPVAEPVVGRGGPVTEAPCPGCVHEGPQAHDPSWPGCPGDAAPDETPRRRCVCSMPGHWGGHDKTQPCGACGGYHPDALKPAAPDETPAPTEWFEVNGKATEFCAAEENGLPCHAYWPCAKHASSPPETPRPGTNEGGTR